MVYHQHHHHHFLFVLGLYDFSVMVNLLLTWQVNEKSGIIIIIIGPGLRSRYSDSLQAGRSGDRIPVGARFSVPVLTGPWAHTSSYIMDTGSSPGGKAAGVWR